MSEKGLWDRLVNSKYPARHPVPTDQEAITGAKRLYRKAMGRPFRGQVKIVRGNRRTWIRYGVLVVNPNERNAGWQEIVHSISHYAHSRLYPRDRPHSDRQAYIERDLTDYVIANGFLEGKLKRPVKPKPEKDVVAVRYQRILDREKRWEDKLKRAKTLLAKARRERRDYERRYKGTGRLDS